MVFALPSLPAHKSSLPTQSQSRRPENDSDTHIDISRFPSSERNHERQPDSLPQVEQSALLSGSPTQPETGPMSLPRHHNLPLALFNSIPPEDDYIVQDDSQEFIALSGQSKKGEYRLASQSLYEVDTYEEEGEGKGKGKSAIVYNFKKPQYRIGSQSLYEVASSYNDDEVPADGNGDVTINGAGEEDEADTTVVPRRPRINTIQLPTKRTIVPSSPEVQTASQTSARSMMSPREPSSQDSARSRKSSLQSSGSVS